MHRSSKHQKPQVDSTGDTGIAHSRHRSAAISGQPPQFSSARHHSGAATGSARPLGANAVSGAAATAAHRRGPVATSTLGEQSGAATQNGASNPQALPAALPTRNRVQGQTRIGQAAPLAPAVNPDYQAPTGRSTTGNPLETELRFAELAVQRAVLATAAVYRARHRSKEAAKPRGPIAQYQHSSRTSNSTVSAAKQDNSPVSIADYAAQILVAFAARRLFPDYEFLGEEDASELRADPGMAARVWRLVQETQLEDADCERWLGKPRSLDDMFAAIDRGAKESPAKPGKRYWVMDPVDGTSAFLNGGQYAVALALIQDGKELLGVLACPNLRFDPALPRGRIQEFDVDRDGLGVMLAATRGHGATMRPIGRGALLRSTGIDRGQAPPPRLRRELGAPAKFYSLQFVDSEESPKTLSGKVKYLAGESYRNAVQLYSSHMRYAAMVLGDRTFVQVRWPKDTKPWSIWDHVGTTLIYKESGPGVVTDLRGRPLDYTRGRKLENNWGVITADASIHGEIVQAVREMLGRAA